MSIIPRSLKGWFAMSCVCIKHVITFSLKRPARGIWDNLARCGETLRRHVARLHAFAPDDADADALWAASSLTNSARDGCARLRRIRATELLIGRWHAAAAISSRQSLSLRFTTLR